LKPVRDNTDLNVDSVGVDVAMGIKAKVDAVEVVAGSKGQVSQYIAICEGFELAIVLL
jgi:hypothetical protein